MAIWKLRSITFLLYKLSRLLEIGYFYQIILAKYNFKPKRKLLFYNLLFHFISRESAWTLLAFRKKVG